jgi:hypothetical protein
LTYPSRPLSQSTSEATRLIPRAKGVAESSSAAGQSRVESSGPPAKSSSVTITRANPLLKSAPKVQAASSSKGSSTPKSTAASFSQGSDFVRLTVASSSKGSAKSKSVQGGSSSEGSAYPRCIDVSFLQGVKCCFLTLRTSSFRRTQWCLAELWQLIGTKSLIYLPCIQIQGVPC